MFYRGRYLAENRLPSLPPSLQRSWLYNTVHGPFSFLFYSHYYTASLPPSLPPSTTCCKCCNQTAYSLAFPSWIRAWYCLCIILRTHPAHWVGVSDANSRYVSKSYAVEAGLRHNRIYFISSVTWWWEWPQWSSARLKSPFYSLPHLPYTHPWLQSGPTYFRYDCGTQTDTRLADCGALGSTCLVTNKCWFEHFQLPTNSTYLISLCFYVYILVHARSKYEYVVRTWVRQCCTVRVYF